MDISDHTAEQWRLLAESALQGMPNYPPDQRGEIRQMVERLQEHFDWKPVLVKITPAKLA